ncbi:MAG: nucleotide exchange factor GrpE [candidate division Zixibacteria bacterium]|nr:nucleotide exchange factor GrpE [candidate division Zixibacteria bacterium]MDH3939205.1 nucleotide exchange factor GrpE [candidate division Zixibacteria bacterium]MDH4033431.1 nucleotide exchange factor GrpE [candidate division Zixibacteria bacterium]
MADDDKVDEVKEVEVNFTENDRPDDEPQAVTDEPKEETDTAEQETAPELTEEERLTEQVAQLEDQLLRAAAEFDNYKKRTARRFEQIVQSGQDRILLELLEVIDNFDRALAPNGEQDDLDAHRKGMKLIYEQLNSLLGKHNVEPIEAVGKVFDPNLHEALMQTDSDEYPEGTVAVEVAKGYRQGDRVIRHSKVGVVGAAETQSSDDESDG